MEGAGRPVIAFADIGFARVPRDFAANDLSDRKTCAQFIKETVGQTHGANMGRFARGGKVAALDI